MVSANASSQGRNCSLSGNGYFGDSLKGSGERRETMRARLSLGTDAQGTAMSHISSLVKHQATWAAL